MERIRFSKKTSLIKIAIIAAALFSLSACESLYQEQLSQQEHTNTKNASGSFRVCSQNLGRLHKSVKNYSLKLKYLVSLMSDNNCSVVALQEVRDAEVAKELAKKLSKNLNKKFKSYLGEGRDKYITNGYLISQDFAKLLSIKSHKRKSLPRIFKKGPSRSFVRGPLEAKLKLPFLNRNLVIYNIHLKSKYNGWKDPTKTNYEIERTESAQAIRDIALKNNKNDFVLVIGDRNNSKDKASDEVLEGRIELKDFAQNGPCKILKNEYAKCSKKLRKPKLLGLFGLLKEKLPRKFKGTHKYKGKESVLDEAFILPKDLNLVSSGKKLNIGTAGRYYKGSDHKMIWLEIKN